MKRNLDALVFSNGDSIPVAASKADWAKSDAEKKPAVCNYKNAESLGKIYGKLYNWYSVNDKRGLCPAGWHVPTHRDFNILAKTIDPDADTIWWHRAQPKLRLPRATIKSTGNTREKNGYWKFPNTAAENRFNFNALPAGGRRRTGKFTGQKIEFNFWTSVDSHFGLCCDLEDFAISKLANYKNESFFTIDLAFKGCGLSVRCLRDTGIAKIDSLLCENAFQRNVLSEGWPAEDADLMLPYAMANGGKIAGGQWRSAGIGGLTATLEPGFYPAGTGELRFKISGTPESNGIAIFETEICNKTCKINVEVGENFMVRDNDGSNQRVVKIGNQLWMAQNLNVSRFANGDSIPLISSHEKWLYHSQNDNTIIPASCYYNFDTTNALPLGRLYNYFAVVDKRGLCPADWKPATSEDWITLLAFVNPEKSIAIRDEGNAMIRQNFLKQFPQLFRVKESLKRVDFLDKEFDFSKEKKVYSSNQFGFSARPGGYIDMMARFHGLDDRAVFWAGKASYFILNEYHRKTAFSLSNGLENYDAWTTFFPNHGFSVRCLKEINKCETK